MELFKIYELFPLDIPLLLLLLPIFPEYPTFCYNHHLKFICDVNISVLYLIS